MAYSFILLLDPCTYALLLIALGTIIYGSKRAVKFSEALSEATGETSNPNSMTKATALIMPVVGSAFLIILFYFLNYLYYLLLVFVTIIALISLLYVWFPACSWVVLRFPKLDVIHKPIPKIGIIITVPLLLDIFVSLGLLLAWFLSQSWIPTGIIAICIAISGIVFTRVPNMKIAALLLVLFFLYDIFWVFLSPYIFGKSVMVEVAIPLSNLSLPLTILFPRFLTSGFALLGLGDIVLPGLLLCYLNSIEVQPTPRRKLTYFRIGLIGYSVGFMITMLMLIVLQTGQPALLYLVPGVFLPVTILAYRNGDLKTLWHGPSSNSTPSPPEPTPGINETTIDLEKGEGNVNAEMEDMEDTSTTTENIERKPLL